MASDEEWSPEREQDPDKIQREMLEFGRQLMERQKKEDAEREEAKKQMEEMRHNPPVGGFSFPSFEKVSNSCKRAWEETKKIAPDAPDGVKAHIFMSLVSANSAEDMPQAGLGP